MESTFLFLENKKQMKTCGIHVDVNVGEETHLTVFKTSLFFAGDGFTIYDCKGDLVFRVDSYGPHSRRNNDQIVLMDASGSCLLTVRRKRPSLHQRWEGYRGEYLEINGKKKKIKPIFSVRRSSISIIGLMSRSGVTVEVYGDDCSAAAAAEEVYQIDGSFLNRSCTILNSEKETVAEIRRKVDASTKVLLGKDVFSLSLRGGFDSAFAMGMVLILDQIHGGADVDGDDDTDAQGGAHV